MANLRRFFFEEALPPPLRPSAADNEATGDGLGSWLAAMFQERGGEALMTTLWMAVAAMMLAAVASLPLSLLGARNFMNRDPFVLGKASGSRQLAWAGLVWASRGFAMFLRAIPEYIWAFFLLAVLGPQAWPAVLALAIHNAGILSRLGADTVENLSPACLRSLRMLGAGRRQLAGLILPPMALSRFLLYFFYRLETCVREATVLGMLGVVSLGYWVQDSRARMRYDHMMFFVLCGAALVVGVDLLSQIARRWLRRA